MKKSFVILVLCILSLYNCTTSDSATEIPEGYSPIYTAKELYNIRYNLTGSYILMNNISLSSYDNWDPIGYYNSYLDYEPFRGVFDGGGHTISGLTINTEDDYKGLFGCIVEATIENVTIKNPSIVAGDRSGTLVGYTSAAESSNASMIYNCSVVGGSIQGECCVGGLAGDVKADVINCYNTATIKGTGWLGGIVGYATTPADKTCVISGCYNTGSIDGNYSLGGIAGTADSISDCYNTGNIKAIYGDVGGIVGEEANSITNCYNTGSVEGGDSNVGGITGMYMEYIAYCYNTGSVKGTSNVGGVTGYDYWGTIVACFNTGSIEGNDNVGGIAGKVFQSSITSSYNTGSVVGANDYVGGVAGYAFRYSSVTACYNTGSVEGNGKYTGGVVGYTHENFTSAASSAPSITACYNSGSVSASSDYGGVVGYTASDYYTVWDCYYQTYNNLTYTCLEGTPDDNLNSIMTSGSFHSTLNSASEESYFLQDTNNYNNGYPILAEIDYTAIML